MDNELKAIPAALTAQCALSTDDLDLTNLPDRLDDATLERVRAIAAAPLPTLPPCDETTLHQCLRMMLSVLPRRQSDEVSGELLVEAYREALGEYPAPAMDYLRKTSIRQCKWFPTVADCIEILDGWVRQDAATLRRRKASLAASLESQNRSLKGAYDRGEVAKWKPAAGELDRIKREAARAVSVR